jgi:HlyD family secretion protein
MQNAIDRAGSLTKKLKLPGILVPIALLVGIAGTGLYFWQQSRQNSAIEQTQIASPPKIETITALGRLQPTGEVIKLSAPTSNNGNRVDRLLVKEGDRVKAGQIIAILDGYNRLQAALAEAEGQVASARAKLAQVEAGAKSGEIGAQAAKSRQTQVEVQKDRDSQTDEIARVQAQWDGERTEQSAKLRQIGVEVQNDRATQIDEIARVQAQWNGDRVEQEAKLRQIRVEVQNDRATQIDEIARVQAQWDGERIAQEVNFSRLQASLENAKLEFDRYQKLHAEGAISTSVRDSKQLALDTAQQELAEAKAALDRINLTSQQQLRQAQTKLKRIESSGKQQIAAAQAALNRINLTGKQQLSQAQTKLKRIDSSGQQQVAAAQAVLNRIDRTSQQQLSQARTKLQRTNSSGQQQVAAAESTLAQIREVRDVDVKAAQVEVNRTLAKAKEARANWEASIVRAPQAGEVLHIHTRSGEVVSSDGIVEIGQTENMEAIAEVYQTDVSKVRLGQKVRVTSEAFEGELMGTVSQIGSQVRKQTIVNTDPSTNIDARVVEVRVKLDRPSSQKAARYTNLQVEVAIDIIKY